MSISNICTLIQKYILLKSVQMKEMLRLSLFLLLLGSFVQCRFAPEERQWEDGDNRQNCTQNCIDECTHCNPSKCSENEDYCGTTPSEIGPDCLPDEVCVPSGCTCK